MTTTESAAIPTLREPLETLTRYDNIVAGGELMSIRPVEDGGYYKVDDVIAALAATPALPVPGAILTWDQRLEGEFPYGTVPHINAMQGEIADLRPALNKAERELKASRALCDEHFNTILDLRAALAAPATVERNAVLEEAALLVDDYQADKGIVSFSEIAHAIRAAKSAVPAEQSTDKSAASQQPAASPTKESK